MTGIIRTPLAAGGDMSSCRRPGHPTTAGKALGSLDSKRKGMMDLRVSPGRPRFCYTQTADLTGTTTMAHIHDGAAHMTGPVVIE